MSSEQEKILCSGMAKLGTARSCENKKNCSTIKVLQLIKYGYVRFFFLDCLFYFGSLIYN